MAKYKISLLTPISDNNLSQFLSTTIGEYYDQITYDKSALTAHKNSEQSFCYTYNEKYSQHQNAQKELTFSMDRKILLNDEWGPNPHVAAIHVGSIIELQDKYDNTILFIVKKITYKFQETNITYNYTCQDAFSYQYSRQQSGYTIENDPASISFIGPKTIDWWVIKKIVPECYIKYDYIPLSRGLYKDDNGKIFTFTNEEREKWGSGSRKIIKEPFTNEDYQTTITFSCSGSSANAALISLGENLDLMIHTLEMPKPTNQPGQYYQYFWFEPKQNQDITGLKYSPKSQISNFGLDFAGDSLTTVLNVEGGKIGDDLITLLPQTPSLFATLFNSKEWDSSKFYSGFFNDIINGKNYQHVSWDFATNNNFIVEAPIKKEINDKKYLTLQLKDLGENHFTIPWFYNHFSDNWENQQFTEIIYDTNTYSGKNNHMYLIIKNPKYVESTTENQIQSPQYYVIHEDEEIPQFLLGKPLGEVYIAIQLSDDTETTTSEQASEWKVYLHFYRLFSQEEKEFANIADQCPWLENRLIDFNYFLKQGIISKQEYSTLLSILQNDLRIVNGKLLFLTDSYYAAVRSKTEYLADLTSKLDGLAAEFHAQVVNPIMNGRTPNDIDITNFQTKYDEIFNIPKEKTSIINYNELLEDYCEKYIDSEQRFLKNIYGFRKYFNEPCNFGYNEEAGVYQYTLTSNTTLNTGGFITFGEPNFEHVYLSDVDNLNTVPWFYYDNGKYSAATLITDSNKTNYFKPKIKADNLVQITGNSGANIFNYSKENIYLITKEKYNELFESTKRDFSKIVSHTINNQTYYELTPTEIKRLIIYCNNDKYYWRDPDTYTLFNTIRQENNIKNNISWIILPNLLEYWDIDAQQAVNICDWSSSSWYWNYYKAFFPINEIYYKGPVITIDKKITTNNNKEQIEWVLTSYDADGKPSKYTDYKTYQPIPFAGNGALLKDWGDCSNEAAVNARNKIKQAWKYSALNFSPSFWQVAGTVVGFTSGLLGWIPTILYASTATTRWCKWKNNTSAYRSFEGSDTEVHVLNTKDGATQEEINSDTHSGYDSYYANYAVSNEAADLSYIHTLVLNKARNIDEDTGKWFTNYAAIENDKITTTNLSNEYNISDTEYCNFYQYIVPSYSFRLDDDNNNLYVKNKILRILGPNSPINSTDTYIRIPVYASYEDSNKPTTYTDSQYENTLPTHTKLIYIKNPQLFHIDDEISALTYYPLYNISSTLDLSGLKEIWDEHKSATLIQIINQTKPTGLNVEFNDNSSICTFTTNHNTNRAIEQYIYARIEDYTKRIFNTEYSVLTLDKLDNIYLNANDTSINPLNEQQILKTIIDNNINLYVISATDTDMIPIADNDSIDELKCYQKINGEYVRIYTHNQIKHATDTSTYCDTTTAKKYYYINNSSTQIIKLSPTEKFEPTLYLSKLVEVDGCYNFKTQVYTKTNPLDFSKIEATDNTKNLQLSLKDENGDEYATEITLTNSKLESLNNITNGTFWYRYHSRTDIQALFEYAAAIETQLQVYWEQAYIASKHCKYFLPQHWQERVGDTRNTFSNQILTIVSQDENHQNALVTLSNTYIPEVQIYINDRYEAFKYKHYLPKYMWKYQPNSTFNWGSLTTNEEVLGEQINDNYVSAATVPVLKNNPGILHIMDHLQTKLEDWSVLENGYTVYYYQSGEKTGMLWSEVAFELLNKSIYEHFDGLYGMAYYIIKNTLTNNSLEDFEALKQQKQNIWNKIYTDYPFLMIEDNYKYELATTSAELLKMAQLVFKGKKEPERGYSISMIDTHYLSGYVGQELKPGLGIQLNAEEYYDEYDDIYSALSQYLFITDVSYSLRSDADVSITVNSIKYQEKLLQSLVKLIR